nr:MAG TPA: hypothetical protein [Caudoviricetes sp.]
MRQLEYTTCFRVCQHYFRVVCEKISNICVSMLQICESSIII